MQQFLDRYSFITYHSIPRYSVVAKVGIELTRLVGDIDLQGLFDRYWLGCMTQPVKSCIPTLVWEFYESYTSIVYLVTQIEGRAIEKLQLTYFGQRD